MSNSYKFYSDTKDIMKKYVNATEGAIIYGISKSRIMVLASEAEVVNPYDNSIKTQGEEKELTLFTCSQKGTMRFVVRCRYKEAGVDE